MSSLVLPIECANGKSEYSIECLTALWAEVGCLQEGTDSPNKQVDAMIDLYRTMPLM